MTILCSSIFEKYKWKEAQSIVKRGYFLGIDKVFKLSFTDSAALHSAYLQVHQT